MPFIKVRIKPGGKIELDFEGFPNSTCNMAHDEILEKLKKLGLELNTMSEKPKEDQLLQQEEMYE